MSRIEEARKKPHYVNNKEFTQAVCDWATHAKNEVAEGRERPQVSDYIAKCLLRMCEGLSHKSNFVRYTYREEMVMDAVENCLKAVINYDVDAATRKGTPNAFGYFTQIAWFAFLRRITKEKKQHDLKLRYINEVGFDEFMVDPNEDPETAAAISSFVEKLRGKIDEVKKRDSDFERYKKEQEKKKVTNKKERTLDSDLTEFLED